MCKVKIFVPIIDDASTWNIEKKVVFLDQHFLAGRSEDFLATIDYELIDEDVIDHLKFEELLSVTNRVSTLLSDKLNVYHAENLPDWYWRNVMFQWLRHVIFSVFDKYTRIKYIEERYAYAEIEWQGVDCNIEIPRCFEEFYSDVLGGECHYVDCYVRILQLYGKIVQSEKNFSVNLKYKTTSKRFGSLYQRLKDCWDTSRGLMDFIKRGVGRVRFNKLLKEVNRKASLQMCAVNFTHEMMIEIINVTNRRTGSTFVDFAYPKERIIDAQFRDDLVSFLNGALQNESDWIKCLGNILPWYIPYCYIEGYRFLQKQIPKNLLRKDLKAILTLTGFFSTPLNFAAMRAKALNGVKLLAIQHGGIYGIVKYVDEYDYLWDDVFYVWNKCKPEVWKCQPEVWIRNPVPRIAPSAKFLQYKNYNKNEKKEGILFAGTEIFLHVGGYHYYPFKQDYVLYRKNQIRLFETMGSRLRKEVTVRNYHTEYGWNINGALKELYPELNFSENYKPVSFGKALMACRLFLLDHISTTWAEALYIRKPMIIILDLDDYNIYPEELPYFRELQRVGVIRTVEDLGDIEEVYNNIEAWWSEPKRMATVEKFRNRYLHNQDLSYDEMVAWWSSELNSIIDNSRT